MTQPIEVAATELLHSAVENSEGRDRSALLAPFEASPV